MKLALAGNPNSGKTTLFNAITGKTEYVGNWPGVTVEKKVANLRRAYKGSLGRGLHGKDGGGDHKNRVSVVDLPGAYSITPYTQEETVTRDFITGESADVIINIVDATSLERSLFFTTQLLELGLPVVVALNKQDLVRRQGSTIDSNELAQVLGCPVIPVAANSGEGLQELTAQALSLAGSIQSAPVFSGQETPDEDKSRHRYVREIVEKVLHRGRDASVVTLSDRVDRIVAHAFWGLPIFALVMWAIYALSINGLGGWASGYLNDTFFGEIVPAAAYQLFAAIGLNELLQSLVVDGILGGVGAVLGFLPLIMVLFFLLALIEDSGYMARIAVVMDRYFKRIGLSGKSIIPMIVGSGCSIPGVMASRTIENESDRRMTIITTSFMPCGAKLPIIALIAGAMFGNAGWVAASAYFMGIAAIIFSGIILKKTKIFMGDPAPFVMELPAYHMPTLKNLLRSMWERGWSFIKKAGTVILLSTIFIWFASGFGWDEGRFGMVAMDKSILARVGGAVAFLFAPLGWGNWQGAVATVTGLVAKENVVGTFGILFGGFEEVAENGWQVWQNMRAAFTPLAAYSFLMFNLLCAPCFSAVGAIRREMNSLWWTGFAVLYQTVLAYAVSLVFYQLGMLFMGTPSPIGVAAALALLFAMLYMILRRADDKDPRAKAAADAL